MVQTRASDFHSLTLLTKRHDSVNDFMKSGADFSFTFAVFQRRGALLVESSTFNTSIRVKKADLDRDYAS